MSYANIPCPVVSSTVTGTIILPGVEVTAGSDTDIPVKEGDNTDVVCPVTFTCNTGALEESGAVTLCKPKNSVTESIKAKCEPPAPNVVTVISNANAIDTNARPLTREELDGFWLLNMI